MEVAVVVVDVVEDLVLHPSGCGLHQPPGLGCIIPKLNGMIVLVGQSHLDVVPPVAAECQEIILQRHEAVASLRLRDCW